MLSFKYKGYSLNIYEYKCSNPTYYEEDDDGNFNRIERKFLPDLTFYRYRDSHWGDTRIVLDKFKAIRETEASYLIIDDNKERWVRKNALRSFCKPSKKEAWESFIARKKKQIQILTAQLNNAKDALGLAREIEKK